MKWPLALLPFQGMDEPVMAHLAARLGEKGFSCSMLPPAAIPLEAGNSQRGQYLAARLLEAARQGSAGRVLGVTDLDMYARGFNYLFGMAEKRGRAGVISIARLHAADQALFQARLLKEAVHELGHTLGLGHCLQQECVMHFSNTLADIDRKGVDFCPRCQARLVALGSEA